MKRISIILIIVGIIVLVLGNVLYGHHQNAVDTGGSSQITTLNGGWTEKIPAYVGGVMLIFGLIFFFVSKSDKNAIHKRPIDDQE